MTDRLIRIKSSRQGYRRGGLDLGSDWLEVETSDLSDAQSRAILADPVLTIEGHEGEGRWSPLAADIRAGLVQLLDENLQAEAGVLEGAGAGVASPEIDPALLRHAHLGNALEEAVAAQKDVLDALGLWPAENPALLVIDLSAGWAQAHAEVDRLTAELTAAKADGDVIRTEADALKAELAQLKNNPASEDRDGGGGNAAAPAAAEPAADANAPATAGGGTAEAAPKPKPTGGGKAKSKAE